MTVESTQLIVLTGAGFSKNFNGFLATEMWSKIFTHPSAQANSKIRNLLIDDTDFESVYARVMEDDQFTLQEKKDFQQIIDDTYRELDNSIRSWVFNTSNPTALNTHGLFGDLFNLFVGSGTKKGFIFTLNQDLLMERQRQYRAPGAPPFPLDLYIGREFQSGDYVSLTEDADEKAKSTIESTVGLVYIKLHGSYGWKSSHGQNQMVLGHNKQGDILREPLLRYYFDLFKKIIAEGGKKILIIGYGFRDLHINKILAEGVEKYGLRIYVITPMPFDDFKKHIKPEKYGCKGLLGGLIGYSPHTLRTIFPPDQSKTTHLAEIIRSLQT